MSFRRSNVSRILGSTLLVALAAFAAVGCGGEAPGDEPVAHGEDALVNLNITNLNAAFYDGGTQCTVGSTSMHCCPPGSAMIGANLGANQFKCAPLAITTGTRSFVNSHRNGVLACPFGQVMVGYNDFLQALACQTIPNDSVTSEYSDPTGTNKLPSSPTQNPDTTHPMHVCTPGIGYTMSGINSASNTFLCATDHFVS